MPRKWKRPKDFALPLFRCPICGVEDQPTNFSGVTMSTTLHKGCGQTFATAERGMSVGFVEPGAVAAIPPEDTH